MTTTTRTTRTNRVDRTVSPRIKTDKTRRDTQAALQPKSYSPTGEVGKIVQEAFTLKMEIDRLKAKLDGHTALLKAHAVKHNLSRIDVGDFQVQRRERASWEYSAELQAKMLKIQQKQQAEQRDGTATNTPTVYVALAISRKVGA